jgi:phenylalanyl-tRNA synthetase beta chain
MEYSLYTLHQKTELSSLTLKELINKLNLTGFEVDDVFEESLKTNPSMQNIRLLIKIPANREDLLNEQLLVNELSILFLFQLSNVWEHLKIKYGFLLQQKYLKYSNYESITIQSKVSNILVYQLSLENVLIHKSPLWIEQKLINSGLSVSSNHWVNLLNLVGIESGHTFQASFVSKTLEQEYHVKQLIQDQSVLSKEGKKILLPKGAVVIENEKQEIQNVLGLLDFVSINEKNEEITSNTLRLETIFYDIHENPLGLNTLNTKLSLRYLRKAFLEKLIFAWERFLTLAELTSSVSVSLQKYETKNCLLELQPNKILKLTKLLLKQTLNLSEYDAKIFAKTGLYLVCETPFAFYFEIPTSRKDLVREIDLIEEYSRCFGYDQFKEILPAKELVYSKKKLTNYAFIRDFFLNHGFNEVLTNSIQDQNKQTSTSVLISNPLNTELSVLREELFSKLLDVFELNTKLGLSTTAFFEIGRIFKLSSQGILEQDKLAGIFDSLILKNSLSDNLDYKNQMWFINKGILEKFLSNFGYTDLEFEMLTNSESVFHPTRSTLIRSKNVILGRFGELAPTIAQNLKLSKTVVFLFEFNLNHFKNWRMKSVIPTYQECSKYPSIVKDLSFSITKLQNFTEIKNKIEKSLDNLKKVSFFDIYIDSKILEKINIGIRLEFQSVTKTLVAQDTELQMERLREILIQEFQAEFKV